MYKEKLKRSWLVKPFYQLFALRYGRCQCCGLPWKYCDGHSINVTEYDGFAPICEYCWETATDKKIKKGIDKWVNEVTPEYPHTRWEYLQAFKNERYSNTDFYEYKQKYTIE
jgi:hypothetical protein